MKKTITFISGVFIATIMLAQSPSLFKYQSVVRDAEGHVLAAQELSVRVSIIGEEIAGPVVCQEVFNAETNEFGLIMLNIGSENPEDFAAIDWSEGPYFIQVEIDMGEGYINMGTTQLLSVPYALFAEKSGNIESDPLFTAWDMDYNDLINQPAIPTVPENVSDFNNDAGYITDYEETDPIFSAWDKDYEDLINQPVIPTIPENVSDFANDAGYLTGYEESDPLWLASASYSIALADISNWNSAYGWGNHDGLYRPVSWVPAWADVTSKPTTISGYGITDAMSTSHAANGITSTNITNWNSAYGWGNHAGLYRPVAWVPAWTDITGKPTTISGYGITDAMSTSHAANGITSTNITNWNSAYGWGNHAGLYRPVSWVPAWTDITGKPTTISGYGITDAMSTSHVANGITSTNITNWNSAYGWGNHASANYLAKSGGTMTGNLAASGNTNISGFNATLATSTATSYTLSANDNGKVITLNNAAAITLTIPSGLPTGFNCLIVQTGAGKITLTASGTTIQNRQSFTKTAGQYAIATLVHIGSNVFISSGDME